MVEAVFKFRATGDVDVSSLIIDYGSVAPSEDWCHLPYVIKVDDAIDNLYELRFPLSPFNTLENGSAVRTCNVYGPIYVLPKYDIPILNVNLTIKQIACLDKLNCEDLLNAIEISVNTTEDFISPDGGLVEVERNGFDPFFHEEFVSLIDGEGNPCTWASFDQDGNIIVNRRGFDELGNTPRTVTVTYRYTYSFDAEIDNNGCSADFDGDIMQRARTCDEADVYIEESNTEFDKEGGRYPFNEIFYLAGEDADSFQLNGISDVSVTGDAFGNRPVIYDEQLGYFLTIQSNKDPNRNLLEDKIGYIHLTYHNKYLPDCVYEDDVTIVVHGLTCDELLENVYFAIKINDGEDYLTDDLFSTDSKELHFTVYIMGDGYAEYFDINEEECVIPTGVTISGDTFTIPENPNELSKRKYTFKFVGEILNEEYSQYSVFGCHFEKEITFIQDPYQAIQEIGDIAEAYDQVCENIEPIPSEILEHEQQCEHIDTVTQIDFENEQSCGAISPVEMSDEFSTNCSSIENPDEYDLDTPTIEGQCE